MTHPDSRYHCLKWASVLSAALFSTSTFASGVGFNFGPEVIAIEVSDGALVGVLGVVFNIKASRLLFFSFLVTVLPLTFLFLAMSGSYGLLLAVTLATPFIAGLAFVYSFIRLALYLFSSPRQ